jgi:gluconolactonase
VRFPVLGPGKLGPEEPYGGALGGRQLHEVGDEFDLRTLEPSVLHRWGFADGCAFDVDGNLWVTLAMANRLVAITPSRTVVDVVIDGGDELLISPTSVAWAGDDLRDIYVGSLTSPYVLRGRSSVPGLSRY